MTRPHGFDAVELKRLYERYAPVAHRRALALLGRDADAWDAVQQVFERLLTAKEQFRGQARPMTYIYRVTTNVCLNHLRHRALREPAGASASPTETPSLAQKTEAADFLRALAGKLSERELEIVALHYVDGLGQEEIAEVLGLSRKTIGRELAAARAAAEGLARPPERKENHG